jgi:hypothetical protein
VSPLLIFLASWRLGGSKIGKWEKGNGEWETVNRESKIVSSGFLINSCFSFVSFVSPLLIFLASWRLGGSISLDLLGVHGGLCGSIVLDLLDPLGGSSSCLQHQL